MKPLIKILFIPILILLAFGLQVHGQNDNTDATDTRDNTDTTDGSTIDNPIIRPVELNDAIIDRLGEYRDEQNTLRDELRSRLDALEEPTPDSRRALIENFRHEHADRIAAQRRLAEEIRQAQLQYRRDNLTGDRPQRDDLSIAVAERKELFNQRRAALLEKRRILRDALQDASDEERTKIIENFREENLQQLRDHKQLRRQLRDELNEDLSGDRRPTE